MFISNGGTWKSVTEFFINIAGTWKTVTDGFVNIAGTWRRFWTGGALVPQSPVTISQSTNTTTYLTTLTGTNYYWSPGPPSLTYYFEWSNNGGSSWTTMLTNTATNPAFGSSTSYTYQIDSVGPPLYFSANAVNTYRFRVAATYGSLTGTSSATTTIQGPTNVTLTAGTATQNSVSLSWTASTGANRYMVYYAVSGNALSLYAGTSNLSITVSGLTPSTAYEFRVLPITGFSNNTGYYGNYSNIATATTGADLTNTAIPTISGTLQEGQTISMSNGSWNLTPDSYSYQWLYYDQPGVGYEGYLPISGATSSSYSIPLNYRDIYGQYIRARVTANKSGYTSKNAYSTGQTVSYDATVPGAPGALTATDVGTNRPYNNAAVDLLWSAPSNNGGSTITGYKIMYAYSLDSYATWYTYTNDTGSTSTSLTVTGFSAPFVWKFRVYAINSIGTGTSYSESAAVTTTTVPQAPTIGTATTYNGYATVTYSGNSSAGKAISSYTATSSPGSITGSASSGAVFVYNLTHNTAYTFTVTASNANGTSAPSSASNTIYGVNIGAPSVNSSTATSSSITLNFTKGTNSTSTRGFLNGSLDGTTSGTSYLFAGLSPSTSYSLGLAGTAVVNGTTYVGSTTTGSYSTSSNAVTANSYPTISGSGQSGTNITFGSGSYNNASTVTKTLRVSTSTSFSTSSGSKGSTSPYTVTVGDANAPAYYFATLDTVVGVNGITYYFWSGGSAGSSATIPAGSGSILSYNPAAVAPTTAPTISINGGVTIGGITYNSSGYAITGGNYYTSAKWTAVNNSPTYYEWQVYAGNNVLTGTNFGSTGNVLSATSQWNSSTYGIYATWRVRGGNSAGVGPWSTPNLVI